MHVSAKRIFKAEEISSGPEARNYLAYFSVRKEAQVVGLG